MHFLLGLLLVIAVSLVPAPPPADSGTGTKAKVVIHASTTEGTRIGWQLITEDGNIKLRLGGTVSPTE